MGRPECAQQPNELEAGLNHGYSVQAPSPVAVFRLRTVFPPFPQEVSKLLVWSVYSSELLESIILGDHSAGVSQNTLLM